MKSKAKELWNKAPLLGKIVYAGLVIVLFGLVISTLKGLVG